jgi:hypothetical protein
MLAQSGSVAFVLKRENGQEGAIADGMEKGGREGGHAQQCRTSGGPAHHVLRSAKYIRPRLALQHHSSDEGERSNMHVAKEAEGPWFHHVGALAGNQLHEHAESTGCGGKMHECEGATS